MPDTRNIVDKDGGYKALLALNRELSRGITAEVGIFAPDSTNQYPDGATVIEAAVYNEFGTADIPERSFLRSTVDENKGAYADLSAQIIRHAIIVGDDNIDRGMADLADEMRDDTRRKIRTLRTPRNAPSTAKAKGFDNPLVETGLLERSVSGRVVKGRQP